MRRSSWHAPWQGIVVSGVLLGYSHSAIAQGQPVADDTLGEEHSIVVPLNPEELSVQIEGGARRGDSLFHSFRAFQVGEGHSVYFSDPGVENILGRVTGSDGSQILGLLGVLGNANLFLINPNGIIFGENAQLDISGSFVATTADAVQFGEQGWFSATDPAAPPMLTVQPSAFLFNQTNPAAIVNNSRTLPPNGLDSAPGGGLRVADGERLTLLGGDVSLDNGGLSALGGRIEVGGLREPGTVVLNAGGSLEFPADVARSDVLITNGSRLSASDSTISGGSVAVTARVLEISDNSGVSAGTVGGSRFVTGRAGDITLDASSIQIVNSGVDNVVRGSSGNGGDVLITADELFVSGGSNVQSTLLGEGSTGQVKIDARDRITIDNSLIFSNLGGADRTTVATGDAGNIEITTPVLLLTNRTQLQSGTFGQGNAGNVIINASESVALENSRISSGVFTNMAGNTATGNGGNIQITTPALSLTDGSQLSSRTSGQGNGGDIRIAAGSLSLAETSVFLTDSLGQGNAGNVLIETQGRAVLDQSYIVSSLRQLSENTILADNADDIRNAGNIQIVTGSLELINGAQIQSNTSGRGNAGNITVQARDRISIEGIDPDNSSFASAIFAVTREGAQGEGGDISLTADLVRLADNGRISAETDGDGDAGNIRITAGSLSLTGRSRLSTSSSGQGSAGNVEIETRDRTLFDRSFIFNDLEQASERAADTGNVRNAGNIQIVTGSLELINGAQLQSSTGGRGNAGNVTVQARDHISIEGVNPNNPSFASVITARTREGAQGEGGDISLTADMVRLADGGQIRTASRGDGDAGNIRIAANSLSLTGRSRLSTDSSGQGSGGNVEIETRDRTLLDRRSYIASNLEQASERAADTGNVLNAGNIQIETGSLDLINGAYIQSSTRGRGSAGNVEIRTRDRTLFDRSYIFSSLVQASEDTVLADDPGDVRSAGNIQIETGSLELINGAQFQSDTGGRGDAGDVTIQARERISIEGVVPDTPSLPSGIFAFTRRGAQGEGGDVSLTADSVRLADDGLISTTTSSRFLGGNVTIDTNTLELIDGGRIRTTTRGDGDAGDINLTIAGQTTLAGTNTFKVNNNPSFFSGFFANTTESSAGGGGTVRLSTSELQVLDQARIEVDSQGSGTAGDMVIAADTVQLDNGRLTAETAAVDGGNIALDDVGLLLLRNGSLISATAGTDDAGGNGGNIGIEADFIVTLPNENSDIRANAFNGNGGSVRIDSQGLFGIAVQRQESPFTSDITASSELGVQGTVDVTTPDTDPKRGLIELPDEVVEASEQITQTCSGGRDGEAGEFVVTGRGGLPPSPSDALSGDESLADWAVLQGEAGEETAAAPLSQALNRTAPMVEAQGWTMGEDGVVRLIAAAPSSAAQPSIACR